MESPRAIYYLLHWFVSAIALLVTAKLMPGFKVRGFGPALWAALAIGFANTLIRPVLIVLTLPINILTLGLFTFVVNGAVLKMCSGLIKDFDIDSWGSAILGSIVLAIVSTILHYFFI